jgi:hypothetical protein
MEAQREARGTGRDRVERWADEFRRASDGDPELRAHGKYFSCSYLLDMEEHRIVVKMNGGRVDEVAIDPGDLEVPYQFAIRASAETWDKLAQPVPAPMYHGLWAATFRSGMRLEGDLLPMMQNLRCLTRQLELLRQTGAPVGAERRS